MFETFLDIDLCAILTQTYRFACNTISFGLNCWTAFELVKSLVTISVNSTEFFDKPKYARFFVCSLEGCNFGDSLTRSAHLVEHGGAAKNMPGF